LAFPPIFEDTTLNGIIEKKCINGENFGSLAITSMETHGFASCSHEQFAFVGFQ
jgi:hypothetical protein